MSQEELAKSYSEQFTVPGYECNVQRELSLGCLLRRSQQIGTDQCALLGLTDAVYANTHTAFLMAKMAVEVYAPLREGDEVTLTTRPCDAQHAVYLRRNEFTAADGALLAAVDTRWVLVDTETRRILRRRPEDFPNVFQVQELPALDITVHRADTQPCAPQTALYTWCDLNGHINNTVYADLACNLVPAAAMQRGVRRFAIDYRNEVPLGASFVPSIGKTGENSWYVRGDSAEGKCHFEAELTCGEA